MNKLGVNPLIITSILVGLTIVIGVTIFGFGTKIQQSAIEANTYDLQELGLVEFSAYYKDANCTSAAGYNCYRIFVKNNEDFSLKFAVTTNSPIGTHVTDPSSVSLGPYEQKIFIIEFPDRLGNEDIYAELDPVVERSE